MFNLNIFANFNYLNQSTVNILNKPLTYSLGIDKN